MANLEPNVLLGERSGRVIDDVFEALRKLAKSKGINGVYDAPYLQTLAELLLLLVDYAQTEVDFVGLLKVGLHAHDLRESFFRVLERAVAVVQNTNSVPKLGLLWDGSCQ